MRAVWSLDYSSCQLGEMHLKARRASLTSGDSGAWQGGAQLFWLGGCAWKLASRAARAEINVKVESTVRQWH